MIQWITGILVALYYLFLFVAMWAVLFGCNGGRISNDSGSDLREVDFGYVPVAPTEPLVYER